ncbi:hypothetical protein [Streptomyces sp. JB150]|uniref:hypothetical protein n=1 Tax=Streptomyces sp. JB150 TaxID=2714844 RepID=UPI00140D5889|nr:hypothetical protein [Streptomyces sp. JB150]QIJ63903.1 hypothetical protein G7Z13_19235 [Streptomyces sp. JB150]
MTTGNTMGTNFEDRLLAELSREIERRASETRETRETREPAVAVPAPGPASVRTPRRRRTALTAPRLGLAALACAAVAGAWALMPGSPAETPAYAVEAHPDGTVTVTLNDIGLGGTLQRELAERLTEQGIHVAVDDVPDGHECARPRGKTIRGHFDRSGGEGPVWEITLRRGDSLAFEETGQRRPDGSVQRVVGFYGVHGRIAPCDPVPAAPEPGPAQPDPSGLR